MKKRKSAAKRARIRRKDWAIPVFDMTSPNFPAAITDAMQQAQPIDPEREYVGQPWTVTGERGKTIVRDLTMRDIADCCVNAWLDSACWESDRRTWEDVYKTEEDVDPIALAQNLCCHIEKMMGIFPNLPEGSHLITFEKVEDNAGE